MKRRYDPDAVAWFAAMPTQPTNQVKVILSNFIEGLKDDNLWSLIDGGNFLCLETLAQGLVDFKSPSRVATLASGFTSTFTSYRGVTGSGSAFGSQDAYIDTGFVPSSASGLFQQDSAHAAFHTTTSGQVTPPDFGGNGTADFHISARNTTDAVSARYNTIGQSTFFSSVTDGAGFLCISRTGAAVTVGYKNGVAGVTTTAASTGNLDASIRYFQLQSSAASTRNITFGCYGAGINATQAANLNTRVQTAISALTVL